MADRIPVNPNILIWARETAGLDLNEAAKTFGKKTSPEKIQTWEEGKDFPTYAQLEKLAEKYNRPLALFFFPEPPEEELPEQNFRTLPTQYVESMTPKFKQILRNAKVMQMNVAELNNQINPAKRNILNDLSFSLEMPITEIAIKVRDYFNIPLSEQIDWKDSDEALKNWRNKIEEHGIYVFKDAFKDDQYSGFCLHDDTFPIIYINNSKKDNRQIFTLFHELAHLLFKTGGIDTRLDEYYTYMQKEQKKIELLCNAFAGAFLVPSDDLLQRVRGETINDEFIQNCANAYHVSRHVVLYALLGESKIDKQYFNNKMEEWEYTKPAKVKKGRGNHYNTKRAYLGDHYLELAFSSFHQRKISLEQLADYLNEKLPNVPKLESVFMKHWAKA